MPDSYEVLIVVVLTVFFVVVSFCMFRTTARRGAARNAAIDLAWEALKHMSRPVASDDPTTVELQNVLKMFRDEGDDYGAMLAELAASLRTMELELDEREKAIRMREEALWRHVESLKERRKKLDAHFRNIARVVKSVLSGETDAPSTSGKQKPSGDKTA